MYLAVVCAGCSNASKQPPVLQTPPVSPTVTYRAGGPFHLPTTQPVQNQAQDALSAQTSWIASSQTPQMLHPVQSEARLITAPQLAEPFRASGNLSRGAQMIPPNELDAFLATLEQNKSGQTAQLAASDGVLPAGVTSTFALTEGARRIDIALFRPTAGDAIEVVLGIESADGQREHVLLDPVPLAPPTRFALVMPSQFSTPDVKTVVAVIQLSPSSDSPEHAQALATCAEQLNASKANLAVAQQSLSSTIEDTGLAAAMRAMRNRDTSRVAMVYLAGETRASVLGDVALVADDPVIAELHGRIAQRIEDTPEASKSPQLGWMLDCLALEQLATMQSSEKLPPELAGVLARQTGEAGRNIGWFEDLTRVESRDHFESRLIAENFTYLQDASPAARVRAYDWLRARGRAPAKYDPLGPAKDRAAAIEAAVSEAARAAAESVPATQPAQHTGDSP